MIIGIIIFLAFLIFLAKAIIETIYGICLIACGIFWHLVGRILDLLIFCQKLINKSTLLLS